MTLEPLQSGLGCCHLLGCKPASIPGLTNRETAHDDVIAVPGLSYRPLEGKQEQANGVRKLQ